MGPFHSDPDFVWSEMMRYWHTTDQLDGLDRVYPDALVDESDFRALGYQISYGVPMTDDPQAGPDAPWSPWVPWPSSGAPEGVEGPLPDLLAEYQWGGDPVAGWAVAA